MNLRNIWMKGQAKGLIVDNIVPIIFIAFTVLGFLVATGVPMNFFLSELSSQIGRASCRERV